MPITNTPKTFPGTEKLPELAQVLLKRFFPPDEMPIPAMAHFPTKVPDLPSGGRLLDDFGEQVSKIWDSDTWGTNKVPLDKTSIQSYWNRIQQNPAIQEFMDKGSPADFDLPGQPTGYYKNEATEEAIQKLLRFLAD